LVVRPKLEEETIRKFKRHAQGKTFARGEVINAAGELIFTVDAAIADQFEQDIRGYFSKKVSALQNARVVFRRHLPSRYDDYAV